MRKISFMLIAFLLIFASPVHAEDASVLLEKYGIPVYDPVQESQKLSLLEEEYVVASTEVNTNEMLSDAYALHDKYEKEQLSGMDREIYSLSDELDAIAAEMERNKDKPVKDLMDLDAKYRAAAAKLARKRQERDEWIQHSKSFKEVPLKDPEADRTRLDDLGNRVQQQKDKYKIASSYPELGDITSFSSPLEIPVQMTSPFGYRLDPVTRDVMAFHQGMDIAAPEGTAVLAAFNGYVEEASENSSLGNYVVLNHGHGIATVYGHLSSYQVVKGQQVNQYETIARSGNTGSQTTGPHLHFGVMINGKAVDPGVFIPH